MQEAERLRAMISRMDIAELQLEANRINGLTDITIDQVKLYFDKLGRGRVGDHMTHLRRHIYLTLSENGMHNEEICKILKVTRYSGYHYSKMNPDKSIAKEVAENFKYWIISCLYPVPIHRTDSNNRYYSSYRLATDPTWKSEFSNKSKTLVKKDDILLDLN
jgi:hypothetical protein